MNTVEETVLDETILDDEPACQSSHIFVACSIHVEYVVTDCRFPLLTCAAVVDHPLAGTRARRLEARCRHCKRPAIECWKIQPV